MEKKYTKPREFNSQGYPQVKILKSNEYKFEIKILIAKIKILMASLSEYTPTWQQSFLFTSTDENDALFNRDTALFIEFFPYEKADKLHGDFKIKNLSAWCSIRLDQRFKASYSDAEFGVKSDSLLIETDGSLSSKTGEKLSASTGLKIVRNKCPKKMSFDLSILPVLESHFTEENVHMGVEPVYSQKKGYLKKLNVLIDDEENGKVDDVVVQKKPEAKASRDNGDFTKFLSMSGTVGSMN